MLLQNAIKPSENNNQAPAPVVQEQSIAVPAASAPIQLPSN